MTTKAATLRYAAIPAVNARTDIALVTLGAALIAACAQISIPLPFTPVPITGQTFAVLLVGASLGTVRGGSSALLYLLAGIAGAPVYADGAHGWTVISGASGGYLLGFVIAAALTGHLAEQRWDRTFSSALGAILTGNLIIFLIGLPWLAIALDTNLEKTLELGLYPFIPGEILKLYLAAALLPTAWRALGHTQPPPDPETQTRSWGHPG
jgi:biotin transport system substrate-specific component